MKVVFDLAAGRIGIEGDGPELVSLLQLVRDIAPKIPNIHFSTIAGEHQPQTPVKLKPPTDAGSAGGEGAAGSSTGLVSGLTLRQFVKSIPLTTASERITAIAYYFKTHEAKNSFSPKEMDNWFTMCGFPKPAQMPTAVFDTKRKSGYLENAGHGQWKLSNQGENLISGKMNEAENAAAD